VYIKFYEDIADRALCAQTDPEEFFPEKGASTKTAKAICGMCEVTVECGARSLVNGEQHGIWGGLAERDRRQIVRRNGGKAAWSRMGYAEAEARLASILGITDQDAAA
jgi:WhiB family redox-sensing transcriptional regulator